MTNQDKIRAALKIAIADPNTHSLTEKACIEALALLDTPEPTAEPLKNGPYWAAESNSREGYYPKIMNKNGLVAVLEGTYGYGRQYANAFAAALNAASADPSVSSEVIAAGDAMDEDDDGTGYNELHD